MQTCFTYSTQEREGQFQNNSQKLASQTMYLQFNQNLQGKMTPPV